MKSTLGPMMRAPAKSRDAPDRHLKQQPSVEGCHDQFPIASFLRSDTRIAQAFR